MNSISTGFCSNFKPQGYMPWQKKLAFGLLDYKYLGHIISKYGLKAYPVKWKTIKE